MSKLPETMTVEELEEEIKREPTDFKKQILSRKIAKLPTVDWLLRHDRRNYV